MRRPCPGESRHEGTGTHRELSGNAADGGDLGGQANECLEEEPGIGRGFANAFEDRPLNSRHGASGRLADDAPKAAPPRRRGDVHHLADA